MTGPANGHVIAFLARLKKVKAHGKHWVACCPGHEDTEPSLSVAIGDNGILLKCHAGCSYEAITAALGIATADLFWKPKMNGAVAVAPGVADRGRMVKSYDYHAADGALLYQACRMEPKSFRQRRPDGSGGWIYNLEGITPVLYRLPEIVAAVAAGRPIMLVEGEKDADHLVALGYAATSSPLGAGKWKDEYASAFVGAEVMLFPDHDAVGSTHMQMAAGSLLAHGAFPHVIELPGLVEHGDVSDWLAAGGTADQLDEIILASPRWVNPSAPPKTRWRLDEIWATPDMMKPPEPVVPYLAWQARSTLLAAREKSGKSLLSAYMSAMVSIGGEFMDEPCQQGPVLIIGLEEFLGDVARRLKNFDARGDMVHVVDRLAKPGPERLTEVCGHMEAVKPVLVIIDSLMAYSQGVITDANDATQAQALVQRLTDLSHSSGVAIVIVHHARKQDGKYRGSSAIGGAVDVIAEMYPPEEYAQTDPTRRRMRPVGRVPTKPVDFTWDGSNYHVAPYAGSPSQSLPDRILEYVRRNPECSASAACAAAGGTKDAGLAAIRALLHRRAIVNDGDNVRMVLRSPAFAPASAFL